MLLGEIIDLMYKMAEIDEYKVHAKTLFGPRTRGSTTVAGLETLPRSIKLESYWKPEVCKKECTYWKLTAPELGGQVNVITLEEALRLKYNVKLRDGAHGPELYAISTWEGVPDHTICIILGPGNSELSPVVYTWHPGPPLACLCEYTAVKLER